MSIVTQHLNEMADEEVFLSWINDWLSVERMAEFYNVSKSDLLNRIEKGKEINHNRTKK